MYVLPFEELKIGTEFNGFEPWDALGLPKSIPTVSQIGVGIKATTMAYLGFRQRGGGAPVTNMVPLGTSVHRLPLPAQRNQDSMAVLLPGNPSAYSLLKHPVRPGYVGLHSSDDGRNHKALFAATASFWSPVPFSPSLELHVEYARMFHTSGDPKVDSTHINVSTIVFRLTPTGYVVEDFQITGAEIPRDSKDQVIL